MVNTRNTNPESETSKLVMIVGALIDTKIECIEQQQDFLHSAFDGLEQFDLPMLGGIQSEQKLLAIKSKFDEFIEKVEQLTYARELLLLIKSFLTVDTAKAIFDLLTNDKYLFYTADSLKRLLGLEGYIQEYYAASDN